MLILYAEDDADDFNNFCEMLEKIDRNIICTHVANGQDTIDFLNERSERPDIIFLDINMPIMDGRSCLKDIRNDPRFSSIPVYIYTTGGDPQEEALCMELGAKGYLLKPISFQEGVNALEKIINENV